MSHRLAFAALLGLFSFAAGAEVLRCVDEAGNVSYTDQRCPAGARPAGQVQILDAPPVPASSTLRPPTPVEARLQAASPPTPAGPGVFDHRAGDRADAQQREIDRLRELERLRREAEYAQEGVGYPMPGYPGYSGYPGARPTSRPQDMRPQLRNCDAGGCQDTQGNTYNRSTGRLDRYQGIDGRTCRPVGTTVVCQ